MPPACAPIAERPRAMRRDQERCDRPGSGVRTERVSSVSCERLAARDSPRLFALARLLIKATGAADYGDTLLHTQSDSCTCDVPCTVGCTSYVWDMPRCPCRLRGGGGLLSQPARDPETRPSAEGGIELRAHHIKMLHWALKDASRINMAVGMIPAIHA